ncbi:hypothetical protein H6F43_01115 [Leptolyngbya sp. FACHB-36]|uniref:hypothetical protein n=1 Tax=Leptolyngbya sp. FACHB-36 TaxID=2692808 RepID=UPI0016800025|nr:hypothetical protein [Leptolyngbya sp. FACHB-36]MBD2018783.1 hypothetical protein [Leptolyngbya sp. FACHB-36]
MTQQIIINLPSDIPMPRYKIGDRVLVRLEKEIEGRICGMTYTSRDVALSQGVNAPGWDYDIELPAFSHDELKYMVSEERVRPALPQEVC